MVASTSVGAHYRAAVLPFIRFDKRTGCWLWQGPMHEIPRMSGADGGSVRRVVWQYVTGEALPARTQLRRTCTNDRCVNPAHMRARGTASDHAPPGNERLDRNVERLTAASLDDEQRGYEAFTSEEQ